MEVDFKIEMTATHFLSVVSQEVAKYKRKNPVSFSFTDTLGFIAANENLGECCCYFRGSKEEVSKFLSPSMQKTLFDFAKDKI